MDFFSDDLASLLYPVSVADFFREYWGKKPLYIPRNSRDYYRKVYSSEDIDDFLRFSAPVQGWNEKVKMAIKFKMVSADVLFERSQPGFDYRMIRKSQRAVSLIMNYIQEQNNRVARMAVAIEQALAGRIKGSVNVNAYLSPGKSYINPHVDAHDELNLQLEGTKRWRVYEPRIPDPYPGMPLDSGFDPVRKALFISGATPCLEVVLQPGDFIYMPRGFWHDPVNTDSEPSLGLTVGVHPICWLDTVMASAKAAAENSPALRQSLPVGLSSDSRGEQLLREGIGNFIAQGPEGNVVAAVAANLRRDTPEHVDALEKLYCPSPEDITALEPDSLLSRPEEIAWSLQKSYGLLTLMVGGREIGLRPELQAALELIHDGGSFAPEALPGEMSRQEKLHFCRFLLNFGALRFTPARER